MRTIVYIVYPLVSDGETIQHDDIHVFTNDRAAENWVYKRIKEMPGFSWEIRPMALDDPVRDMVLRPRRINEKVKVTS